MLDPTEAPMTEAAKKAWEIFEAEFAAELELTFIRWKELLTEGFFDKKLEDEDEPE